jgi:hypothetical protein
MTKSAPAIIGHIRATAAETGGRMCWLGLYRGAPKSAPRLRHTREIEWGQERQLTFSSGATRASLRSVRSRSSMMRNRSMLASAVRPSRASTGCWADPHLRCDPLGSWKCRNARSWTRTCGWRRDLLAPARRHVSGYSTRDGDSPRESEQGDSNVRRRR